MKKLLLMLGLLLPLGCLLVRWSTLPTQVPLHFSRGGADVYGDKYWLWAIVFVPLLAYASLSFLYRTKAQPQDYRPLGLGVALFLSFVLCIWLVVGMPAA